MRSDEGGANALLINESDDDVEEFFRRSQRDSNFDDLVSRRFERSSGQTGNFHSAVAAEAQSIARTRKEVDIIEKYPDRPDRVRFKTAPPAKTPDFMQQMIGLWNAHLISMGHPMDGTEYRRGMIETWNEIPQSQKVHPLIAMAAMNLDFLCIHPFRDGNGRVSRLLLLLECYHLGYEVGRYISLERLIEENKERYYETLEQSSQGWHERKHDPWPYINCILSILKSAYREFEEHVGQTASPRGAKTEMIVNAIGRKTGPFRVADLQRDCPGVSLDMIRRVLKDLRPQVECLGRGQSAQWQRTKKWESGNT